jgi:hypothetical protein
MKDLGIGRALSPRSGDLGYSLERLVEQGLDNRLIAHARHPGGRVSAAGPRSGLDAGPGHCASSASERNTGVSTTTGLAFFTFIVSPSPSSSPCARSSAGLHRSARRTALVFPHCALCAASTSIGSLGKRLLDLPRRDAVPRGVSVARGNKTVCPEGVCTLDVTRLQ